ncbi:Acetylornithine aminotransferase [compost metagenome]
MGNEEFKQAYRPLLPNIKFIDYGSLPDLNLITTKTAAVFMETVQGEAGIRVADKAYFEALRAKCNETGTLLVFDEIQCGFGRTGRLFGFEHFGIVPDILLLAKGIGGGMPIGAFISSHEIMISLATNPILGHITTFGGHPVSCAAGLATLQTILSENITNGVTEKGLLFKKLLQHPAIKEVRGIGLMMAIEFENFELNKKIIDACIVDGLISDWFLHCSNSMRLAPPLIITEEEIEWACGVILKNVEALA